MENKIREEQDPYVNKTLLHPPTISKGISAIIMNKKSELHCACSHLWVSCTSHQFPYFKVHIHGCASSSWDSSERNAYVVFHSPLFVSSMSLLLVQRVSQIFLSLIKGSLLLHLKTWLARKPAILYTIKTYVITEKVTTLGFTASLLGFLLPRKFLYSVLQVRFSAVIRLTAFVTV